MIDKPTLFIRNLLAAAANAPLYGLEHPHVRNLLEQALASLREALVSRGEIAIDVIGDEIVIDSQPQPYNIYLCRCAALFSSRGVGRLRLTKSVTLEELTSLVVGLSLPAGKGLLVSSSNIRLGQADFGLDGVPWPEVKGRRPAAGEKVLRELTQEEAVVWRETQEAVQHGEKLQAGGVSAMVSRGMEALQTLGARSVVSSLLQAPEFSHAGSVALLTMALAMAAGISGSALHEIGVAALLHDIGKVFLPQEIASRDDLTEEESRIMREHPVRGSTYLLGVRGLPRLAVLTALEHHMRYDGTGYPSVCIPWKINSCSHMTAIADFFATRWASRSGRGRSDLTKLSGMMTEEAGTSLHPALTAIFVALVENVPLPDSASASPSSPLHLQT